MSDASRDDAARGLGLGRNGSAPTGYAMFLGARDFAREPGLGRLEPPFAQLERRWGADIHRRRRAEGQRPHIAYVRRRDGTISGLARPRPVRRLRPLMICDRGCSTNGRTVSDAEALEAGVESAADHPSARCARAMPRMRGGGASILIGRTFRLRHGPVRKVFLIEGPLDPLQFGDQC
jgi:hypothetical protein